MARFGRLFGWWGMLVVENMRVVPTANWHYVS
jgi:hypothetical protein